MTEQSSFACMTEGSAYCRSEIAELWSIDPDGRIHGACDFMASTWWYPDGRHNTFRDLNLSRETVEAFKAHLEETQCRK